MVVELCPVLLNGSVAEAVLRRAPCRVLTVKSPKLTPGHRRIVSKPSAEDDARRVIGPHGTFKFNNTRDIKTLDYAWSYGERSGAEHSGDFTASHVHMDG